MISRLAPASFSVVTATVFAVLSVPAPVVAQPKPGYSPSSTHIFPAGGRRGTTVRVRIGTECTPRETDFLVYGQGLTAGKQLNKRLPRSLGEPNPRRKPTEVPITYPREWGQQITIASDAPLGQALWRISCAQGGTGTRPFLVGDLPEHIETESNSVPGRAEQLTLPVTLNGQVYGERDIDFFRLKLKKGQVLVCDVLAGRIGSRLDPMIQLLDADGRVLNAQEIRIGRDPVIALEAPHDGDYLLRVANITFHGNAACVYRITLSTRPLVVSAFPSGGKAGTSSVIEFHRMTGRPGPLAVEQKKITFPVGEAVLRPWGARGPALSVNGNRHATETEPNNGSDSAGETAPGTTMYGRLSDARDLDRFTFTAKKGRSYSLAARAAIPGAPILPVLTLTDTQGKRLGRATAVGNPDGEARIEWSAAADGKCQIELRDLRFGSRGGSDFLYRMTLEESALGFSLHSGADAINLMQDKDATLTLRVKRTGGFQGPIDLALEGLPKGVTFTPKQIAAKANSTKLVFKATADVASRGYPLSISGTASINGKTVSSRLASRHLGVDGEGLSADSPDDDRFHLTVCHKPVFRLFCNEAYMYAHRRTVYQYAMEVERLDGFDQPITVQIGDRQNRDLDGIQMIPFVIPSGRTEGFLPIYLPETMHINIQSQSQLYSQAFAHFTDKTGRRQAVLVLSEKRNMLRTRPVVVKMFAVDQTISGAPGSAVPCRLRLERTTNFPGEMTVRLHAIEGAPGFQSKPVRFAAGKLSTTAMVRLPTGMAAAKPVTLVFRATGKMPDGTEAITESRVRYLPVTAAEK